MNVKDLDFKNGNPGAVQFGNFINYYKFHPPLNRIKLLPKDIWAEAESFYGLDIGCNAGDLTVALYNFIKTKQATCRMLGVDIDSILIERAKTEICKDLTYLCVDFMVENERMKIEDYLKENGLCKFSAVFCFSITMWIHLNHGDQGLQVFLKHVSQMADLIIIEPQPWKCYKSAVKRMKQSSYEFTYFKEIQIRDNVEDYIEQYLKNECKLTKMFESERSEWSRKILIFKNI